MNLLRQEHYPRANAPKRKLLSKWPTFLIHFFGLAMLFLLPDMLITLNSPDIHSTPPGIYIKALVCTAVFYANFYFIIPHTFKPHPKITRFALYNILLLALSMTMLHLSWTLIDPVNKPLPHRPFEMPVIRMLRDVIILILTIALSVAIRLYGSWNKADRERREMEALRKEMELAQLRSQLNPHFLFNTLNGIYALVGIDPDKAREAIHRLSNMLRYMLYNSKHPVTVSEEFRFIESYVELMKMRLSPDFPLTVTLDCSSNPDIEIQPLMFVNIIENAFKFGTRTADNPHICISLTVNGTTVECHAVNTYTATNRDLSSGIGLKNLRRRLELRYPEAHQLTITDSGNEFVLYLTINLSNSLRQVSENKSMTS